MTAFQTEEPASGAAEWTTLVPAGNTLQNSPGGPTPKPFAPSVFPGPGRWRAIAIGYGSALATVAVTIAIAILLTRFSISINLTILVVAAILIPTWIGGKGPGILVAVAFELVTILSKPPAPDATLGTYIFGHVSVVSLYVVLVLVVDARHKAVKRVKEHREWLKVTLSSINDGVIATDTDGVITFINPIAEDLTGWTEKEAVGRQVDDVFSILDELTEQPAEDPVKRLLRDGVKEGFSEQAILVNRTGKETAIDNRSAPIKAPDGTVIGVVSVFHDISKRMRSEIALRDLTQTLEHLISERTSELEAANKELEAFSYSVSHDLRAPLRQINGYSQALVEDHSDKLDEIGKGHLQEIQNASQEMKQLIDDLLQLARVARADMHREEIDLSSTARGILNELKKRDPKRIVDITIEPGLTAYGDKRLLRIALTNLLENAWKFTSKRDDAAIVVGWRNTGFFVSDNGAGFDMAYREKLYRAFQRLHSTHEFEGTGIGLATVQWIIQRHGGNVWAEGEVDKGATFYFTLPIIKDVENEGQGNFARQQPKSQGLLRSERF